MEKKLRVSLTVSGALLILLIISVILHNIVSGMSGVEEPVFFILFLILLFAFPLSLIIALVLWMWSIVHSD